MHLKPMIFFVLILLSACSSKPSNGDIQSAMENMAKQEMGQPGLFDPDTYHISDLAVANLSKNDAGNYVAEISFTSHFGEKEVHVPVRIMTLANVDGEWTIVSMR